MDDYEHMEVTNLEDLPEEVREYVDADAEVLLKKCLPTKHQQVPEWKTLIYCMALHKHQIEVCNTRMDDITKGVRQLAQTVMSFGSDFRQLCEELDKWQKNMGGGDDDWWKKG